MPLSMPVALLALELSIVPSKRTCPTSFRLTPEEEGLYGLPEAVAAREEAVKKKLSEEGEVRVDTKVKQLSDSSEEDDLKVRSDPDLIHESSKMTVKEYQDLAKKLFSRYDFDQSGTLNSSDELQQLSFNLAFQLSQDPHNVTTPDVSVIETECDNCGELNDDNAWNIGEFTHWFAFKILKNKLPGYFPPPK